MTDAQKVAMLRDALERIVGIAESPRYSISVIAKIAKIALASTQDGD